MIFLSIGPNYKSCIGYFLPKHGKLTYKETFEDSKVTYIFLLVISYYYQSQQQLVNYFVCV